MSPNLGYDVLKNVLCEAHVMVGLRRGKYAVRTASTPDDVRTAQTLRRLSFSGAEDDTVDCDAFDPICTHILVEDQKSGTLVCCFRFFYIWGRAVLEKQQ